MTTHFTARRTWLHRISLAAVTVALTPIRSAFALSWGDISNQDAVAGLKSALNSSTVKELKSWRSKAVTGTTRR